MVLRHKPKHRATHSYLVQYQQDLYALAHRFAHDTRIPNAIRAAAFFSVRHLKPRPSPALRTKGKKNPKIEFERN